MDARKWAEELAAKLQGEFGERLLFVGLQGSRLRGEETPESDIDIMTVLDTLSAADLARYRRILRQMPMWEKACGFIGGREELLRWPAHEVFSVEKGTAPVFGTLDGLLPPYTREDIRQGVRIGASALYHGTGHLCLYGGPQAADGLRDGYKAAFFLLQSLYYLRTGEYIPTKRALCPLLAGEERRILKIGMDWEGAAPEREQDPQAFFDRLLQWSGKLLAGNLPA